MKKYILLFVSILLLFGCRSEKIEEKKVNFEVGYSSNLVDNKDREELKRIFQNNNVSNIDLFFSWLDDYNKEEDNGCGIQDFNKTENFKYDELKCSDRYLKNHEGSDGNGRVTAYALVQDLISIKEKAQNYGNDLSFDINLIENNINYKMVNESLDNFISLFDEMSVSNLERNEYKDVFTNKWKDYGIQMKEGNVSLITVIRHNDYTDMLFVGHAGILIKLEEKYLFVEKVNYYEPYQVSVLKNVEDLKNILMKRSYSEEASEEGPFVYENNKLLFELE